MDSSQYKLLTALANLFSLGIVLDKILVGHLSRLSIVLCQIAQ